MKEIRDSWKVLIKTGSHETIFITMRLPRKTDFLAEV
jgi:hypothetical protein